MKHRGPNNDWISKLNSKIIEKFYSLCSKSPNGCWVWAGTFSTLGYSVIIIARRRVRAHRLSYYLHTGQIPGCIDHLCRNIRCTNPEHLEATTIQENTLRGIGPSANNARKTHCPRGHELSGTNLVTRTVKTGARAGRTYRACRACENARNVAWRSAIERNVR